MKNMGIETINKLGYELIEIRQKLDTLIGTSEEENFRNSIKEKYSKQYNDNLFDCSKNDFMYLIKNCYSTTGIDQIKMLYEHMLDKSYDKNNLIFTNDTLKIVTRIEKCYDTRYVKEYISIVYENDTNKFLSELINTILHQNNYLLYPYMEAEYIDGFINLSFKFNAENIKKQTREFDYKIFKTFYEYILFGIKCAKSYIDTLNLANNINYKEVYATSLNKRGIEIYKAILQCNLLKRYNNIKQSSLSSSDKRLSKFIENEYSVFKLKEYKKYKTSSIGAAINDRLYFVINKFTYACEFYNGNIDFIVDNNFLILKKNITYGAEFVNSLSLFKINENEKVKYIRNIIFKQLYNRYNELFKDKSIIKFSKKHINVVKIQDDLIEIEVSMFFDLKNIITIRQPNITDHIKMEEILYKEYEEIDIIKNLFERFNNL